VQNDPNLQLELMKREPATVEVALIHAINVKVYEQSLACHNTVSNGHDAGQTKHWPAMSLLLQVRTTRRTMPLLCKHVGELQEVLELATKGVLALAAGAAMPLCRMLQ